MNGNNCFKEITNKDIYDKLINIEKIATNNQIQIKVLWVLLSTIFLYLLTKLIGGV